MVKPSSKYVRAKNEKFSRLSPGESEIGLMKYRTG